MLTAIARSCPIPGWIVSGSRPPDKGDLRVTRRRGACTCTSMRSVGKACWAPGQPGSRKTLSSDAAFIASAETASRARPRAACPSAGPRPCGLSQRSSTCGGASVAAMASTSRPALVHEGSNLAVSDQREVKPEGCSRRELFGPSDRPTSIVRGIVPCSSTHEEQPGSVSRRSGEITAVTASRALFPSSRVTRVPRRIPRVRCCCMRQRAASRESPPRVAETTTAGCRARSAAAPCGPVVVPSSQWIPGQGEQPNGKMSAHTIRAHSSELRIHMVSEALLRL